MYGTNPPKDKTCESIIKKHIPHRFLKLNRGFSIEVNRTLEYQNSMFFMSKIGFRFLNRRKRPQPKSHILDIQGYLDWSKKTK